MIEAAPAAGEAPHGPPGTLPDEPPKSGPHDLAPQDAGPIDIRQIMAMLPHRYPMLLVDRVESLIPGKSIRAVKAVTINEHFFVGHFPGRPIMPGVMIIEALAQAAGILALKSLGYDRGGKLVYFMGIDEAKFRVPVEPGVLLTLDVEFVQKRPTASKFFGRALIGERIAAQASFTAMIADSPEN